MNITSAKFIRGIVGTNDIFEDGTPQIVFIGRSNAGKSSVINSLANQKNLAKTSSRPGSTKQINVFLINKNLYLVDLPGYGYAKMSKEDHNQIQKMLYWYLFKSAYEFKKVVLIIDANVGPTDLDMEMILAMEAQNKDIIIVANKVDKLKTSKYKEQIELIKARVGEHMVIPYSAENKIGVGELTKEILQK